MKQTKLLKGAALVLTTIFGSHSVATAQGFEKEAARRIGVNTITSAVPFLLIAPDSRAGGMGDAGVATSPDASSAHWNSAKYAFVEDEMGISVSYTPWLRALVPDINLSYLSGYKKLDEFQTISASLLYFSLGNITFTDITGQTIRDFNPNELAFDVSYSRKLSDYFSGGIALRYINSNLTGGMTALGMDTKPGRAVAVDVTGYYQNSDIKIGGKDAEFAAGVAVTNIGNKMAYTNLAERDFIPINLRLGPRLTLDLDKYNSISITTDINKLLVPTPPAYNDDGEIAAGKDPNRAVASGMFGSFTDAPGTPLKDDQGNVIQNPDGSYEIKPGSVFSEELREIYYATGFEYWYDKQFAMRAGYFWEDLTKGNRKFFTLGAGLKWNVLTLDFAYLMPVYFNRSNSVQGSPLANTLRFSLTFNFESFKDQGSEVL